MLFQTEDHIKDAIIALWRQTYLSKDIGSVAYEDVIHSLETLTYDYKVAEKKRLKEAVQHKTP